jgi:AAA+ ATPase superfamily predicted ATPase
MPNPFKYGTIVTDEDFADRKEELELLVKELANGQNMILYSPRRFGKSSLMIMGLRELQKKGIMTAFIDLYDCTFLSDLVDKIVKETVIPAYDKIDKAVKFLGSALKGLRPAIVANPDGSFEMSYKREVVAADENVVLSEVLDAPEKLAIIKKKHLVVVFDEFQEVENYNGKKIENIMRTHFQHHRHVTYVFMGSKRHMMQQMFTNRSSPFFKFAKPFPLGKIPKEEFKIFFLKKFKNTNVTVTPSLADKILAFTDGNPYYTQLLCHEIWNITCEKGKAEDEDFNEAIDSIMNTHSDLYISQWDSFTVPQRKLLVGISMEEDPKAVYSTLFIKKYELMSASHVSRALKHLLKAEFIEKTDGAYVIADIFFKEWIKRRMRS